MRYDHVAVDRALWERRRAEYSPVAIEPKPFLPDNGIKPVDLTCAPNMTIMIRAADQSEASFRKSVLEMLHGISDAPNPGEARVTSANVVYAPSREDERRAIDALLREDARKTPAFATARKAAVLAAYEDVPEMPADQTAAILRRCAEYEELRGSGRNASLPAADMVHSWRHTSPVLAALTAYERARGMR